MALLNGEAHDCSLSNIGLLEREKRLSWTELHVQIRKNSPEEEWQWPNKDNDLFVHRKQTRRSWHNLRRDNLLFIKSYIKHILWKYHLIVRRSIDTGNI